jgi:A/G-specific adenine glycosylase
MSSASPLPQTSSFATRLVAVHDALLGWYARSGRDLPWRLTRDPYPILVSEIMLQQTQVERVRPKFHEFLACFPSFESLAQAPVGEVIRRWAPLGYNRRAVRLHNLARTVVTRFEGRLPERAEQLGELEGLGSYTANAVACFAFGQAVPVVDTNVRRVLGRLFADLVGLDPPGGRSLERFAAAVLPADRAYEWNQALMDLGATICTARAPACSSCPMALVCAGRPLLGAARSRLAHAAERRASYTTREPYARSTRFYRGRIVDQLRRLEPGQSLSLADLAHAVGPNSSLPDNGWIGDLVDGLRRDGLASIVEDQGEIRVALP